ncbi:DUF11 domain-containing protein [Paenibacillus lycopersici]|uniref:DUF11 domain-containing protein n=1 Tax=Paenibacillus lycopersici TaxID=2704462 RepID=A0A6C0G400_9BACL|nr:DUF11 domain-containing protein [Paenibacillus lycopersici]QHT63627.1 DUF11 domain-containing protein [Paenibacillus lycopersici]
MVNVRPTDDPAQPGYWIGSGLSLLFDAGLNDGAGGFVTYNDLIRISKGATLEESEECDCTATVTLDIDAKTAVFQYYPNHPLDVVFVLDVTSSMMTNSSTKFVQAKRAIISTIIRMWAVNRDTTVTIVPYGRAPFLPNQAPQTGFAYDYLGTLFTWKRGSSLPGYYIGQILGYRNQTFVSATDLTAFEAQSVPLAASAQLSLYNFYNYYKIRYGDIYDDAGNPLPDTVLSNYIASVYDPADAVYNNNQIKSVASGIPLTPTELAYSMNDAGYANNSILQNMVWAIPYSEDTNTEAGIQAAYRLFKTPGFAQSDDILRRDVILITDGQANRSVNPAFPNALAAPGDTDAQFFPVPPGIAWRYFTELRQTLPTLVGEISNRSSTFEEIALAAARAGAVSARLKDPADGNASFYALGINIDAQTPGPYTRQNVIQLLESWVSAPSFFREADTSDPESQIADLLNALVQDIFRLSAGSRVVLHDQINTALFAYAPGSIRIRGIRDGLLLKSPNQPDIVDPADPDFTVYAKAPLLPDVDDGTVSADGAIVIDFGVMPPGLLSSTGTTTISLAYELQSNRFANGSELHTNVDGQTYVRFTEPAHLAASSSTVDYTAPSRDIFFQTPIVACACTPVASLGLLKFPDRATAAPGEGVTYTIEATNTGTLPLTNVLVDDPLLGIRFTIPLLDILETFEQSFPFTIPAGTPDGPFRNVVTATAADLPGPVNADAVILVAGVPALIFRKLADKTQARPGELVTFTLIIENTGTTNLTHARITDELLGIDTTVDLIEQGASVTADFPFIVPEDAPIGSTIVNIATVATDQLPPLTVGVVVEVIAVPALALFKEVDQAEARPGTTVTFTITAVNTGSVPLTNVRIADPVLALDQTVAGIAPGASVPIAFPFLIPLETPPKRYFNTATAVSDQTGPVEASAEVTVLPAPQLGVSKVLDRQSAAPGETIAYRITLGNLGNVALGPFRITDSLIGIDEVIPGLAVGEILTRTVTYEVPPGTLSGSVILNRLIAASPEAGTIEVEASVTVAGTTLAIAKTPDRGVAMTGEIVVYRLSVTNVSAATQTNVLLSDATLGYAETIPVLLGGETVERDLPFTVPAVPDGTVIRNEFTCRSDQSGPLSAEAEVVVYVELAGTVLTAEKLPDGNIAEPGSTVIYTVRVTNIGGATASDIIVADSLTGARLRIPALAAGESGVVSFPYAVPPGTPQGTVVHNRVVATSPQADPVTSEADVTIGLPHFFLRLAEVVDRPVAEPGSVVYFTVTVTNVSPFTLTNVRVFEDRTALSAAFPSLAPGETRSFVRPFRIPPDAVGGTTFVSTSTAFSNETPFEQASASVVTFTNPAFTIDETVDRPVVHAGETVFFTITVRNVGNVDLIHFRFHAPLLRFVYVTDVFPIGAEIVVRVPFRTPDTDEEIVIPSPVTGEADNAGPKQAEASVRVIPDEEE